MVYLNLTDPNTTCPLGWQLTNLSKRKLVLVLTLVTHSPSLSVEETTLECVGELEAIRMGVQMHLMPIIVVQ